MRVGLVWPTPGIHGLLDENVLRKLHETKATHLRINIDMGNPQAFQLYQQVLDAGFLVLPVLDLDYMHPNIAAYGDFCLEVCERFRPDMVELMNEPRSIHGLSPEAYRYLIEPTAEKLQLYRPQCRIAFAGDCVLFSKHGPRFDDWLRNVNPLYPEFFDAVAVHTYREPGPPEVTRYESREQEYDALADDCYGLPMIVTEVGWNISSVTEQEQADYLYEELSINDNYGIEMTFIYAHISEQDGGFGVLRADQSARPAVEAIARFVDEHS
jgi:hypothetical protein